MSKNNEYSQGSLTPILWCRQRTPTASLYLPGRVSVGLRQSCVSVSHETALKMLEPVLHQRLRLASGVFRTIPVQRLHVLCNKWCLEYQRAYMNLLCACKLSSMNNHPFKSVLNDTSTSQLSLNRPSVSLPFSLRMREEASGLNFLFRVVHIVLYWYFTTMATSSRILWFVFYRHSENQGAKNSILQHFLSLQDKYNRVQISTVTLQKLPEWCPVLLMDLTLMYVELWPYTPVFSRQRHMEVYLL